MAHLAAVTQTCFQVPSVSTLSANWAVSFSDTWLHISDAYPLQSSATEWLHHVFIFRCLPICWDPVSPRLLKAVADYWANLFIYHHIALEWTALVRGSYLLMFVEITWIYASLAGLAPEIPHQSHAPEEMAARGYLKKQEVINKQHLKPAVWKVTSWLEGVGVYHSSRSHRQRSETPLLLICALVKDIECHL